MATLIHLCRKDFSFAKHVLLGSWVVFLVAALMPRLISGALAEAAMAILGPLLAVQYFQVFASVLKILRADSFSGGHAFIGTRPVTMTMLWLSKLAAIAAFVLLPYLLAQVISVFALRVYLTPADWMLFFAEKTLLFGLPASIALIIGTHTRHFVWTTMLTIAFGTLMLWLFTTIFDRFGGFQLTMEARHIKTSQWLVAQVLISIAAILLAWLWMAQRRMAWSIGAGLIALAVVAGVSTLWKLNFVRHLALAKAVAIPASDDLRIAWLGKPRVSVISRNDVLLTTVFREWTLEGVPDGWLASPVGVRSSAHSHEGHIIASGTVNISPAGYGDATRALLPSLGIRLPMDYPDDRERLRFSIPRVSHRPLEDLSEDGGRWRDNCWFDAGISPLHVTTEKTCTISGECLIELTQPVILANLPAQSGTSACHGRFRYHIEKLEAAGGGISLKLVVRGVDLASRGDWRNKQDDIEILLINRKTGKHTVIGHGTGGSSGGLGWLTIQRSLSIDDGPPGPGRQTTDPQTFLKDARLYLIGGRHGGTVRVPFEMPEVELKPER